MRLATLRDGSRDGRLVVVRRDGEAFAEASRVAPTLQDALDGWEACEPGLRALAESVEAGRVSVEPLDPGRLLSPLPRAYEWVDGSAYLNHVRLVRRARGAEPPPTLETDPLVYQGGSGVLLAPCEDIPLPDPAWGMDFEAEVCVVLGDVPRGATAQDAERHVRLLCLANDVTHRNLVPARARQGLRLLPVEAGDGVLAVRGHARRARGRLARRAPPPAPLGALERRAGRRRRHRRDALLLPRPRPPRREDARLHGGDDPRQRHRLERRSPRAAGPASPSSARER